MVPVLVPKAPAATGDTRMYVAMDPFFVLGIFILGFTLGAWLGYWLGSYREEDVLPGPEK